MPKHKLRHYNGELNPEQTASGMNAASRNAHRLLSDAKFMFDGGRYATAAALAILAIEEERRASSPRCRLRARAGPALLTTGPKDYSALCITAAGLLWP